MPTEQQMWDLASVVWQVLDDMGREGQHCSGLSKADLRIYYEPFKEGDPQKELKYPLSLALEDKRIILGQ